MVSIIRQLMLKLAQKRGMVTKADRELEIENPTPPVRARIQKKRIKDQQEVERLEQEIRDKVGPDGKLPEGFFEGGMVNNMRKPVISRGLSGLISNYSSGPLAKINVPRETPQNMFRGGAPGFRDFGPRGVVGFAPLDKEIEQSAIQQALQTLPSELLATAGREMGSTGGGTTQAPANQALLDQANQSQAYKDFGLSTTFDPATGMYVTDLSGFGFTGDKQFRYDTPKEFSEKVLSNVSENPLQEGGGRMGSALVGDVTVTPAENLTTTTAAENLANRTAIGPVTPMDLTGQRPTDFLGYETTEGAAELATSPGQTPFEPGMLLYEGNDVLQSPVGPEPGTVAGTAEDKTATAQEGLVKTTTVDPVTTTTTTDTGSSVAATTDPIAATTTTGMGDKSSTAQQGLVKTTAVDPIATTTTTVDPVSTGPTAAEVLAQEAATADAAAAQTQETRVENAADKIEEAAEKQVIADTAAVTLVEATNQGADAATVETLTLDADLKQQDADYANLEATLAVQPDPDPIYEGPTQGELLQASEQAQAEAGDLFTTPTDTGEVIDRGSFGTVDTVATADAGMQNATTDMYVASDGTVFTSGTLGRQYDQQLQANQQGGIMSFLGKPDFDVSSAVSDYTTGYPSSQDMQIKQTYYPYQQLTDEQKENAYIAEVFKPVPRQNVGVGSLRFGDVQGRSTTETGTDTGTDTSEKPTGDLDTGAPASAPGEYGLNSNQMYQCKAGYTLKFINGKAMCSPNQAQDPDGGRASPYEADVIDLGGGS